MIMTTQSPHDAAETVGIQADAAPMSVEQTLARCLGKMRALAATCGTDDYYENWAREVLDRRPLVLVAALTRWQNLVWVLEAEPDPKSYGVLYAELAPHTFTSGLILDPGEAEIRTLNGKALATIAADVGWLVKEETGEFPRDAGVWPER
jgi:hypothetical protein